MNANIIKTLFFYKMKYDLQGPQRSHKIILKFQRVSLAHCLSPSLTLSLCFSLFSLSRSSLFLFFSTPHPTSASYPTYASLSFHSPSFFFSLFFILNLRSYGQLFVLVLFLIQVTNILKKISHSKVVKACYDLLYLLVPISF